MVKFEYGDTQIHEEGLIDWADMQDLISSISYQQDGKVGNEYFIDYLHNLVLYISTLETCRHEIDEFLHVQGF